MPIRTPPQHNTVNPPGTVTEGFDRYTWLPKTLGEVIDKVVKSEERLAQPAEVRTYDEGYAAGLDEGYSNGWRDAAAKYGVW